jgi:hypothetical protein
MCEDFFSVDGKAVEKMSIYIGEKLSYTKATF